MDGAPLWQQTLQHFRAQEIAIVAGDELTAGTDIQTLIENTAPLAVKMFFQYWQRQPFDPWQALLQSVVAVHPSITEDLNFMTTVEPLRALLSRAERIAILCQPSIVDQHNQRWSYLFQIKSTHRNAEPSHLILYPPATSGEITEAQAILRLFLPPGYRYLLMLTNGLSIGPFGIQGICGAGSTYANWKAVLFNEWVECEKYPREIAANWRAFQGIYDYERIRDWESGTNTFLADETILVPFARTYETWCFDRTRPNLDGEYPVVLWDHEAREGSDYYADFATWLANEVEIYFFG